MIKNDEKIWQELGALETLAATLDEISEEAREELMPRIVAEKMIHGHRVSIVEPVMPLAEGGVQRGYLWTAVIEPVALVAGYVVNGVEAVPGRHVGGEIVAHSHKSVSAVLENARRILKKRPVVAETAKVEETVREIPRVKVKKPRAPRTPKLEQYTKVTRRADGVKGIVLEIGKRTNVVWAAVAFGDEMVWTRAQDLKLR